MCYMLFLSKKYTCVFSLACNLQLIDELMTYDATYNSSYRHLWRVSETEYEYKFFHGPDYGIDANTSFTVSLWCDVMYVYFITAHMII